MDTQDDVDVDVDADADADADADVIPLWCLTTWTGTASAPEVSHFDAENFWWSQVVLCHRPIQPSEVMQSIYF